MRLLLFAVLLSLPIPTHSIAQLAPAKKQMQLVTWFGPGGIALPLGGEWEPTMISVYDKNMRPVIEFENHETKVTLSFALFENNSGMAGAEGCRKDAIDPILEQMGKNISDRKDGEMDDGRGGKYATTSYAMKLLETAHNHDVFAFAGDAKVCAEVYASVVAGKPDEEAVLKAALAEFRPDLAYKPTTQDFYMIGTLLYKRAPEQAAPYYKASLETMPQGSAYTIPRRVITDQLVLALGRSGDLKDSRAVAQQAIASDPEYPLNYYNLACADAEAGDAANAKVHLQQAFDRRANMVKGKPLPNPTTDSSLLKLKSDKAFWAFVEGLPKS